MQIKREACLEGECFRASTEEHFRWDTGCKRKEIEVRIEHVSKRVKQRMHKEYTGAGRSELTT